MCQVVRGFYSHCFGISCLETKNQAQYAFVIKDSELIGPTDLPGYVYENIDVDICHDLQNSEIVCEEKTELIEALKKSMGNKSKAARILGISRGTVWNRMRKYNVNPKKSYFLEIDIQSVFWIEISKRITL